MAGPSSTEEAAAIGHINVSEPGDSTLSCEELKLAVADMDGKVETLQAALSEEQADQAYNSAMIDMSVANAYQGIYGNTFGSMQSALGNSAKAIDQQELAQLNVKFQNAQQRRDNLTQTYNQRCF